MSANCPWCATPLVPGPKCPRCGAIYAKAEAIRLHGRANLPEEDQVKNAEQPPASESALLIYSNERPQVTDPELEVKLCMAALPIVLILGMIFHAFNLGHFLQRTLLSMPIHEFGHAFMAWFCGRAAMPTLWKTLTADSRGVLTPMLVTAAIIYTMVRTRLIRNWIVTWMCVGLLLFQVICTLLISSQSASALITFGGDAGAMVFGTLLMTSFFYGKNTQLYRGSLRWGFLVIGAGAFVDTFSTWWSARSDVDAIPYGEIEGVGLSDPSRLTDTYGWTQTAMVHRYVNLGLLCLAVLVCVWIWGIHEAKKEVKIANQRKAIIDTYSK
jgi:hypothetical protein